MSVTLSSERKKIVQEIKSKISEKPVLCIGGYVKSGKTLLLKELEKELRGSVYFDAKTMSKDAAFELTHTISDSIKNSDGKIYLIDNFSYLYYCDQFFDKFSYELGENETTSARIIVTGNKNILKALVSRFYFLDDLDEVHFDEDYLSFAEWEELHGSCSEKEYLERIAEFHGIVDFRAFLGQCLDNAQAANRNSVNVLYNNDCAELSAEFLLDAMSSVLYLNGKINGDLFDEQSAEFIKNSYERFMKCTENAFKQALIFLYKNGIVSISDNADAEKRTIEKLLGDRSANYFKGGFFRDYTVSFKHPIFLSAMIKQLNYQKQYERNFSRRYFMETENSISYREELFMSADAVMGGYAMWYDTDAPKPRLKVIYLDNPDYTAVMAVKWQHFEEESCNMPRENLFELKFIVERNAILIIDEWNEKKST